MFLVIDIGGTNSRVATFEHPDKRIVLDHLKIYDSMAYPNIEEIIRDYEGTMGISAGNIVIGVPGPVVNGAARTTNLPWAIDKKSLKATLALSSVDMINDVEALGHSIEVLLKNDFDIINPGKHHDGSPAALIAPGTGLGESYLIPSENGYNVYPSEGGHADFAPTNAMEIEILRFLLNRYGHVSYERVCSGPGIYNIYEYLSKNKIFPEPPWLSNLLAATDDPARTITQNALSETGAAAITVKAIDIFTSILGAEAGNMAMRFTAKGGIYIGGGIAPKILPFLKKNLFIESVTRKGRFSGFVSDIPVQVIRKPEANLYGLANYARKAMNRGNKCTISSPMAR